MPLAISSTVRRVFVPAVVLVSLVGASSAMAAINSYASRAAFDAATAGMPRVVTDFESIATGTVFAPGTGPAGAGFVLDSSASSAFGQNPLVSDAFWAPSGVRFLGSQNSDQQFYVGDTLTFTFDAPASGFGLLVVGGRDLSAGDIRLSAAGAEAFNVDDANKLSDGNGSFAFFVGLASDNGATFGSAALTGVDPGGGAFYVFAVDDVIVAAPVPEPSMALMLALGASGVVLAGRRRARFTAKRTNRQAPV